MSFPSGVHRACASLSPSTLRSTAPRSQVNQPSNNSRSSGLPTGNTGSGSAAIAPQGTTTLQRRRRRIAPRECESRRVTQPNDSGATIRRAGIADAAALARLRWIWRTHERGEYGLSQAEFEGALRLWWASREESHVAYIAERDGDAVGMAWLAVFDRIPQPRDVERIAGNVQSVFVLEAFRNQGIGGALVEAVIAHARARGAGYLIVHPSQRAYPLYERLGFAATRQLLHMDLDRAPAAAAE